MSGPVSIETGDCVQVKCQCLTFISTCNQPPETNSAFYPSGVGKWGPAMAGKAKAGMVHPADECGVCR